MLVSRLGLMGDEGLVRSVSSVHAVVGGEPYHALSSPLVVKGIPIVQAGLDGERLGRLDVTVTDEGRSEDPQVTLIALTDEYADEPEIVALVASFRSAPTAPPAR